MPPLENNGKTVCIDYSSINIAKPFHIGHLLTTAIGGSLYRISKFCGYNAVGINHLGDWGTQFGKLIVAYKKWGDDEDIKKRNIRALLDLYVRFHKEAEAHPELEDEGRHWFKKIEEGDKEALAIFESFKQITLREVQKVYDRLGITFDSYAGESFYNDKMQPVIDTLKSKNLLKMSEGAEVVDLGEYGHAALPYPKKGRYDCTRRAILPPLYIAKRRTTFTKIFTCCRISSEIFISVRSQGAGSDGIRWAKELRSRSLR